MHKRIVLVYSRINHVTKHLFLSFLAFANITLYLLFIVNQNRWERLTPSRILLSSSIHGGHHAFYRSGGCCLATCVTCGHSVGGSAAVGVHWLSGRFHRSTSRTGRSFFVVLHLNHLPSLCCCLDSSYHMM